MEDARRICYENKFISATGRNILVMSCLEMIRYERVEHRYKYLPVF